MTAKEALRRSGENLKVIREHKNYSVEALAVLSGVNPEMIIAMEAGNFDFQISMEILMNVTTPFRRKLTTRFGGN